MDKTMKKNVIIPTIVAVLYSIYYYLMLKMITESGFLININEVTWSNLGTRLTTDFFLMLLFPVILISMYRKELKSFSIRLAHRKVIFILGSIVILLFVLHNDYTLSGFYYLFFHLIVVAFGEEFIFRGYVYSMMKRYNRISAVLVSGILWGSMHAILPGLAAGDPIGEIGLNMISQLGFGIAAGYYFIYIMEKSSSLLVPILVHAILNYTVGPVGVITGLAAGLYFFILTMNEKKDEHIKEGSQERSASV